MPRKPRESISAEYGSMHIISRTAGNAVWFDNREKEYIKNLLLRFAQSFYVHIHSYCIMSNHFHILLSDRTNDAKLATPEELLTRYQKIYGKNSFPPEGSINKDGSMTPDEDGGILRLRNRLGSISRFIQEFKQSCTRWYNKQHDRKGYMWGDRFKSVAVDKGEARLVCSAYIDLNPVRAGITTQPDDYRWSSLGWRARQPNAAARQLQTIFDTDCDLPELNTVAKLKSESDQLAWYREFVYLSGGVERVGKGGIHSHHVRQVTRYHGHLGIGNTLRYRLRNISEGVAIGSPVFIEKIQRKSQRKIIRPRPFLKGGLLYATRVLHPKLTSPP